MAAADMDVLDHWENHRHFGETTENLGGPRGCRAGNRHRSATMAALVGNASTARATTRRQTGTYLDDSSASSHKLEQWRSYLWFCGRIV